MPAETTYTPPLAKLDADVIAHTAERCILIASQANATIEDARRYGMARMWIRKLMQGDPVTIPDAMLAESRRIITRAAPPETTDAR